MLVSDNTKAILLLTAPLMLGKNTNNVKLLSNSEYHQLAVYLKNVNKQPSDLLTADLDNILENYAKLDKQRISLLLNRGFLLSQVLDYWHSRNIWVISRADKAYPNRLKNRLSGNAPPVLYGCGNIDLLNLGGLSIVGSRSIDDELIHYTMSVAELSAQSGKMVISGGAKGADLAAMQGALRAGGMVCGILADGLEKAALNASNRLAFQEKRLVLISACDPKSRFSIGNAMQRNKYIYALSDIGLVINAEVNKGGTWAGAIEQLEKYRQISIYVRSTGIISAGLKALEHKGALPWINPKSSMDFLTLFEVNAIENSQIKPIETLSDHHVHDLKENKLTPDQELFLLVKKLIEENLQEPKKEKELAELLKVSNSQMKVWLQRLLDEKVIGMNKNSKSKQYVLYGQNLDLFV